ncbi:MAG TPA: hypothetical protein VIG99_11710 [Myxococcaceae bacterium]|jgi:hypothetical protein
MSGRRLCFAIDALTLPAMRRMVEDIRIEPWSRGQSRLIWSVHYGPAPLEAIRRVAGDRRIHVICHCLGSVSFLMSLFGGATKGITSVIANSVGLTPRVPRWSQLKLQVAPFLIEQILGFPYISPGFSQEPMLAARAFSGLNSLVHRECDVPACHMLSLMWGTGASALYSHDHLHDVTHRRGGDLYGGAPGGRGGADRPGRPRRHVRLEARRVAAGAAGLPAGAALAAVRGGARPGADPPGGAQYGRGLPGDPRRRLAASPHGRVVLRSAFRCAGRSAGCSRGACRASSPSAPW